MMPPQTVQDVLNSIDKPLGDPLPKPHYVCGPHTKPIFLAWHNFSQHMTDEGWQLQEGLREFGYELWGKGYPNGEQRVPVILKEANPDTCIVQDKREWDLTNAACFDKGAGFLASECLSERPDIFTLTVLKDAHQQQHYHRQAAEEIGCHAWITYYHPAVVSQLAPYVRREHLIRTYHSLDAGAVPPFTKYERQRCLISGALGPYYPLRTTLANKAYKIGAIYASHPGYHANGSATPIFLQMLSAYKVAICTASRLGYALRKIIEATACGCRVITDLPVDEVLPWIDSNLIRIHPCESLENIKKIVDGAESTYSDQTQYDYAELAKRHYDYRSLTRKLAVDIESLRLRYADAS